MITTIKIDKKNIKGMTGSLFLEKNEELISDMKAQYDLDISRDQKFLSKAMLSSDGSVRCSMLPESREIFF